jgi:hypothetical protein
MAKKKAKKSVTFEKIGKEIDKGIKKECDKGDFKKSCKCSACGGGLYFLGFLGAAIYYISTATGFWMGVLGFLKAIIWPLFLVYSLMKYLGM